MKFIYGDVSKYILAADQIVCSAHRFFGLRDHSVSLCETSDFCTKQHWFHYITLRISMKYNKRDALYVKDQACGLRLVPVVGVVRIPLFI